MSKQSYLPDPTTCLPIIRHLCSFGEATRNEVNTTGADPWRQILCDGDLARYDTPADLLIATKLLIFEPQNNTDVNLMRALGFRYQKYRERLLTILIHGMVNAMQAEQGNLMDRLEDWVIKEIPGLTPEINVILDELEMGNNRLVDLPQKKITVIFEKRFDELPDFDHWDKTLLGHSASSSELFSVVLEKFGKVAPTRSIHESPPSRPIALLPEFPIADQMEDLSGALIPAPWTTSRETLFSSLPLFNAEGNPLFDLNKPTKVVWQDALAQQPYYRVVIHLAYAHRLGIGEADQVVLLATDNLMATTIEVGGHPVGLLSEYLPKIVQALGYHPILGEEIAAQRTANLLQNLLALHILSWEDGILSLAEDYALSLGMRPRAQTLSRGQGKQERNTILAYLHNEITKQIA